MSGSFDDYETLDRDDAINLWLQGKDAWNEWVNENPKYNIDFSRVKFDAQLFNRGIPQTEIYIFPEGKVSFKSVFNRDIINFQNANFENSSVDFSGITFASPKFLNFKNVKFGKNGAKFNRINFQITEVSFRDTIFRGNIDFSKAMFQSNNFNFIDISLEDCHLIFDESNFYSESKLKLTLKSNIGNNRVSFDKVLFSNKIDLDFCDVNFRKTSLSFKEATTKEGKINFSNCTFESPLDLRTCG
jgi:uncharacterized protein YjbI with pentapeptide repeats